MRTILSDVIAHGRSLARLALHKPLYGDKVSQYDSFDREHLRFVGTEPSFHFVESGIVISFRVNPGRHEAQLGYIYSLDTAPTYGR